MQAVRLMVVALMALLSLPAMAMAMEAQDLVGVWIIQSTSPAGVARLETATFARTERGISGTYVKIEAGKSAAKGPIEVAMTGNSLSLKVDYVDPEYNAETKMLWKGRFDNKQQFRTTVFFLDYDKYDMVPFETRVFRRSSAAEIAALKAKLPKNLLWKKLPLPALRDLPPDALAKTPPMGWSSWNHFTTTIDDKTVRETADALVSSGLRDAGYVLVEVDDGWQGDRDSKGILHPNAKFPDMKALADYVHSKGLKFGIYTSPGPLSCDEYVGSHGFEAQDAKTFASWGVDFVMYDWCSAGAIYTGKQEMRAVYQKFGEALRATGRPIVYKLCEYGAFDVGGWGRKVGGNLWRTGQDNVMGPQWLNINERFADDGNPEAAGPGGWNDADNLTIGVDDGTASDRPLTLGESRTEMTLWAILASPLILGNDVRNMTDGLRDILLNKDVIAVDQDPAGKQGRRIGKYGSTEVWVRPLSGGAAAVALFNRGETDATIKVRWSDLNLADEEGVRELWPQRDLGRVDGSYSTSVPTHGAVLLKLTPVRGKRHAALPVEGRAEGVPRSSPVCAGRKRAGARQ